MPETGVSSLFRNHLDRSSAEPRSALIAEPSRMFGDRTASLSTTGIPAVGGGAGSTIGRGGDVDRFPSVRSPVGPTSSATRGRRWMLSQRRAGSVNRAAGRVGSTVQAAHRGVSPARLRLAEAGGTAGDATPPKI